jgi:hypothetical protein
MTDHDTLSDYDLDDWEGGEEETLPKRPRRRLITPISATLAGALVGALGFIGGVEVQKGQDDGGGSGANGAASAFASAGGGGAARGGFGRGGGTGAGTGSGSGPQFGGPGGAQSNATVGSVANKKGSTLYVKDSDGNLVRVKTTSHSKINRIASSSAGAIHPGDTVIVQGSKSSSGTITATQIQASAAGATGGLAGLFGGGGRFGGGGGGGDQQQGAPQPDGG